MKDVFITIVCVAVLGAAGFCGTYQFVNRQQSAAIATMQAPNTGDRLKNADAAKRISQQEAEDIAERYKDSVIVAAIGIIIGIGVGVLICDMLEKKQPKTPVPA
jgi:hypothetical protein